MKKILMSTSALVAAGMLVAAPASAKVKLGLGGFMSMTAGFVDNDESFEVAPNSGLGQTERDSYNLIMDSEVYFTGNTKLNNGTRVDVIIQMESDQATGAQIDESYLKFTGGFGDVRVGSTAFATAVLRNTAVYTGPYRLDTPDLNNFITVPAAVTVRNGNTHAGAGNDAVKVAYISPIFNGLRFGASWLNDNSTANTLPAVGGNAGTAVQSYDIGVQYSAKTFKVDLAHGKFIGAAADTQEFLRGGFNLTMGATKLGASMMKRDNVGSRQVTIGASKAGTTDSDQGDSFDIGISHKVGDYTIGVAYFNSNSDLAAGQDDEETSLSLGASTAIGPGVTGSVGLYQVDHTDATSTATNNNDGWALIGQVKVAF
jgi:outer membrane protein OmpU